MQQAFEVIFRIFSISTIRYFLFAGVPFIFYYSLISSKSEKAKIQPKIANKQDYKREIAYSMQMIAVTAVIGYLILFSPFTPYTKIYKNVNDYPIWWLFASVILSLIIHDTYFYWMHRLLHHPKIFRYVHLVHHQSTNPSPFTSYAFNFIETITENAVIILIVMFLPMHQIAIILFVLIGFIINVYGHLGYEISPKWLRNSFVFEIVNTSVHHNLHHSKFKGNYGLYFRIWDRILKTENSDYVKEFDRVQASRFGK
jgi:lathosterol oxidase